MTDFYGIDLTKKITPSMVRDAIVECFFQAHCADSGIDEANKEGNRYYCREIVEKAFTDRGFSYENPTKQNLIEVLNGLADFSKNFRNPEIIKKHFQEMMGLIEKID